MGFSSWFKRWYVKRKVASERDEQKYTEEVEGETREFLADSTNLLRWETEKIYALLNSEVYSLRLPPQFSSEKDNPWLNPEYRIQENNRAHAFWTRTRDNQTIFTQRGGEWLVANFFTTYGAFIGALDELAKREDERRLNE